MKKYLVLFLFVIIGFVSAFSQKVTVTKPSVAELISIMDSKKPLTTLSSVAAKSGFKHDFGGEGNIGYSKFPGPVYIGMNLYSRGKASELYVTTYTKKVADSWMSQLQRLGYLFDGTSVDMGGNKQWRYSKPTGYSIEISKYYNQFELRIKDDIYVTY